MACHLGQAQLLLVIIFAFVKADIYYVTPSSAIPCPEEGIPCLTISEYASKPSNYFSSINTTLIVLPGDHFLERNFEFSRFDYLMITSTEKLSPSVAVITCKHNQSFGFDSIEELIINGIQFHCVNTRVTSAPEFVTFLTLTDCIFQNYGTNHYNGNGLELQHIDGAVIRNCIFSKFSNLEDHTSKLGGAIYLNHSGMNISDSFFDSNIAALKGGAIGAENGTILMENVTFTNNRAIPSSFSNDSINGGALYANNSKVVISDSLFQNNSAVWDEFTISVGGAICTSYSNISIDRCLFVDNQAIMGGAVVINRSSSFIANSITFISNTATYFYGGAMQIYHSNATISDTVYQHNTANKWGGALHIQNGNVSIYNADFQYNKAGEGSSALHLIGDDHLLAFVFINNIRVTNNADCGNSTYTIIVQAVTLVCAGTVEIVNNSCGPHYVGVLYIVLSTVMFSGNTTIANNNRPALFHRSNVTFEGNTNLLNTRQGRAFEASRSNIKFNGITNITSNKAVDNKCGGAMNVVESSISMYGITNIENNQASCGGAIFTYQGEINIRGTTFIIGNTAEEKGGGLYAIDTTINYYGQSLSISNNTAMLGGGMFLELNSKLYIYKEMECNLESCNYCNSDKWLRLDFANNSAVYGAALYISDQSICASISTNENTRSRANECFLQSFPKYSGNLCKAINLHNIFFSNNSANSSGDTIYGGLLDRCTLSPESELFKKYSHIVNKDSVSAISFITNVTNIEFDEIKEEVSSLPVRLCFCRLNYTDYEPDCDYQLATMNVKKGETIRVPLVAVDQVNNSLPNIKVYSDLSVDAGLSKVGQTIQRTKDYGNCTVLQFNIISLNQSENLTLYADGPCKDLGISPRTVRIEFLPCPTGFNDSGTDCECHPSLRRYVSLCFIDTESVLRKGDPWISVVNASKCSIEDSTDCFLTYQHCPYDYCHPSTEKVWINLNEADGSDEQCAFNRTGILCGACSSDLSLTLGSSQCKKCSNEWVSLLIVFALAGITLVVFLLVCNLTVAVGTINGVILYANIIATNRSTFFPSTFVSPSPLTVFIAWLNLDFGFITCFYDGLDGYAKTWLQFIFPLYIIFLLLFIIFFSEYSRRFARLISTMNPVATLATLLLLSYTKLFRTIISVFEFAILKYPDGSQRMKWLVDANIDYFSTKHIPLFIVAIVVLIVSLFYTILLIFWQCLQSCPEKFLTKWIKNPKLHSFMDAYHAPYNAKHRYWTGLLLFVRIVLYLVSVVGNISGDPNVNLLFIICAVGILQVMSLVVYKKWLLSCLEGSFLLNCTILSAATLYVRMTDGNQAAVAYTSTVIAFVTFAGILFYHTCAYAIIPIRRRCYSCRKDVGLFGFQAVNSNDEQNGAPAVYVTHSEIEGPMNRHEELEDFLKATQPLLEKN